MRLLLLPVILAWSTVGHSATFTVTTLADSGPGSLREAIASSNATPGANTIVFAAGLSGTLSLTSGEMLVTQGPLTINGPGAAVVTVDGNSNDRIISVEDPGAVACPALTSPNDYLFTISGLTLRNGNRTATSSGGALVSRKSLAMHDMVIDDNEARLGGGVAFLTQYPGQSLSIRDTRISNNLARPLGAVSATGGGLFVGALCAGVYSPTTVELLRVVVEGNRVTPVDAQQGYAGGVYLLLPVQSAATISSSRIVGNSVQLPAIPGSFSYAAGGVGASVKDLTISGSEIAGNTANAGGGIEIFNVDAARQGPADRLQFRLFNSTVSGNTALASGGGIQLVSNLDATIANSTITANTPQPTRTGGMRVINNAGLTAPSVTLASSIIAGNLADTFDVGVGGTGMAFPFAIAATRSLIGQPDGPANLTLVGTDNLIGADPGLDSLAFNSGLTRTHALKPSSLAIDTGANPQTLTDDQRGTGFPRVQGTAADIGAYEYPPSCAGFTDYDGASPFCRNLDWMRNRRVTLGCSAGNYCSGNNVQREQMAAFLNRLGQALSPVQMLMQESVGPLTLPGEAPEPAVRRCISEEIPAAGYPRQVLVRAAVAGLADSNLASWRAAIVVSYEGVYWDNVSPGTTLAPRTTSLAGAWSSTYAIEQFDLAPGATVRFGVNFRRDQNTVSTGNLADARCQLIVDVYNRNPELAPH